jgi:hypothetical protein
LPGSPSNSGWENDDAGRAGSADRRSISRRCARHWIRGPSGGKLAYEQANYYPRADRGEQGGGDNYQPIEAVLERGQSRSEAITDARARPMIQVFYSKDDWNL